MPNGTQLCQSLAFFLFPRSLDGSGITFGLSGADCDKVLDRLPGVRGVTLAPGLSWLTFLPPPRETFPPITGQKELRFPDVLYRETGELPVTHRIVAFAVQPTVIVTATAELFPLS